MTNHVYIYDAVRTPRSKGKKDGALHEVKPIELGAGLFRELQKRHDLDTAYVDDVMMGCTAPVGEQGANVAKTITDFAGWDNSIPAVQMDRYCASSLDAVNSAAQNILSGWNSLIVAGGVESMSRIPMGTAGGAFLMDPEFVMKKTSVPQGVAADMVATMGGWSREDMDAYALQSQQRAAHALENGYFDQSVVPVVDQNGMTILAKDDFVKPDTTLEKLASLKPSFELMGSMGMDDHLLQKYPHIAEIDHVHTPGNSSGIVDGASAVLLGSEQAGKDLGLTPRGRILAGAVTSTDPSLIFLGPAPAAERCLKIAGLKPSDIDLWEINEAFASAVLRYMKDLDISPEITNVNGGAIALGHPLGATGAMLVSTMLDELERTGKKRAMLSLCAAGGIGISTLIERV
ncbi:MAG: acetyl-CoA C-acetyltransferase [Candidatus Pelagadaptatus aseana]|uniref:acetyl-CoA C-acetyltransferase n=1 Tax=Candidatus Pelagadaptatus aseana TaxID=3120508 RepID=UPI0039B34D71